ncbi:MAG: hypothetical protein IPM17_08335 [Verrucomicrobia bacterium]|nr:hypothetical protein [Verrucomicrobiota bacterium]
MIETNLIEDLRPLHPPDHGWVWVPLALAALVLGALAWQRFGKRRAAPAVSAPADPSSFWQVALAELERLEPLLRPERSREYGLKSTDVLRRFIESRYGLRAPTLATEEFLSVAAHSPALPLAHRESLGRFLALGDLFKFGRYVASAEELRRLHATAVDFLMASRPPAAPDPAEGGPT